MPRLTRHDEELEERTPGERLDDRFEASLQADYDAYANMRWAGTDPFVAGDRVATPTGRYGTVLEVSGNHTTISLDEDTTGGRHCYTAGLLKWADVIMRIASLDDSRGRTKREV